MIQPEDFEKEVKDIFKNCSDVYIRTFSNRTIVFYAVINGKIERFYLYPKRILSEIKTKEHIIKLFQSDVYNNYTKYLK